MSAYSGKRPGNPHELFTYWVNERELIRQKKELWGQPKPWSDDPIFQTTYFCNIRREDDKVTRWIRANYLLTDFYEHYEWAICIARLINWPTSLSIIKSCLVQGDVQHAIALLQDEADKKKKVWGGAYVVTTHGQRMDKLTYLSGLAVRLREQLAVATLPGTLGEAHKLFKGLEGFSDFMAAQVIADLKNTVGHVLKGAPDWWDWAAPGPGSLRGMAWYYGLEKYKGDFLTDLHSVREETRGKIPNLCLQDLQNCLCEYDKFMRILNGTGRSKRNYNGV